MNAFRRDLEAAVDGEVRFDRVSRAIYSTDASPYQVIPTGVLVPRSRDDVVEALAVCRRHGVSMTARGGGTSQAGQAIGAGLQVDFSKYMNRVLELDTRQGSVRVEPGLVLAELNAELAPHGLELPLDLSTANRATIGGMIANNSAGTRSIVYGTTVDYIEELEVLLADGSIVRMGPLRSSELERKCAQGDLEGSCYRTVRRQAREHAAEIMRRFPKLLRRNGGYRLDAFLPRSGPGGAHAFPTPSRVEGAGAIPTPPGVEGADARGEERARPFNLGALMAGSEGTLGIVLSARLRLVAPPPAQVLGVVQFASLRDALAAVPAILSHDPSAVELMDRNLLDMTAGKKELEPLRDFVAAAAGAVLVVELLGDDDAELVRRLDALDKGLAGDEIVAPLHRAVDAEAQARIWKLRQAGLGLSMSETGDTKGVSFVEDAAVAPERLPEYIDRFQAILERHGARAVFYAHASVGLLHIRPSIDMKTSDGIARFEAIAEQVADLVVEFGGALSGEHGDGMVRSPFQERLFGPELYRAFCAIKDAFDPEGIFNPGKIVRPAPLAANLRYGTDYRTNNVTTVFDFSDFGGLSRAAEQCGGVGACRKTLSGTMCPSFLATRDETDNTRGRATALRLAISGQLGFEGIADPALYPVLDLCLECKACKTECPTGVDMARMKAEFLHHHRQMHGTSARSRVLGRVADIAAWGSRTAPLSSWALANPVSAWLAEKALGLDRRRALPPFARRTFVRWSQERDFGRVDPRRDDGRAERRADVAVFADTFTNHYEPWQGKAAVRVAEKLGFSVVVPPRVCCGRPLISKGFLNDARDRAEATVRVLAPFAAAGTPIVFCEPSCFSAVHDDHPRLVGAELRDASAAVAAAALTFEQWAEREFVDRSPIWRQQRQGAREPSSGVSGRFRSAVRGPVDEDRFPKKLLLHGHCHQKALVGTGPATRLLGAVPGCEVVDVDAGCCGMAGSFGYEREHYDISRAVGEHRLFPAVRDTDRETLVVAPGFSCRQQIEHFTGTSAVSSMQVLEQLVPGAVRDDR